MHPKAQPLHPRKEKVYVKVNSDTDQTGHVVPKLITWADGRQYQIEDVKDFRPAGTIGDQHSGDCYTVISVCRGNISSTRNSTTGSWAGTEDGSGSVNKVINTA